MGLFPVLITTSLVIFLVFVFTVTVFIHTSFFFPTHYFLTFRQVFQSLYFLLFIVSVFSCDTQYLYLPWDEFAVNICNISMHFCTKFFNMSLILSWKEREVLLSYRFPLFSGAHTFAAFVGLFGWTIQPILNELPPCSSDVSVKGIASVSALPGVLLTCLFIHWGSCNPIWMFESRNFPCFVIPSECSNLEIALALWKMGFARNVTPHPLLLYISVHLPVLTSLFVKHLWVPLDLNAQLLLPIQIITSISLFCKLITLIPSYPVNLLPPCRIEGVAQWLRNCLGIWLTIRVSFLK